MPHVLWVGIVVVVVGVVVVGVLVLVIIGVVDLVEPNGTTANTRSRELTCRNRCELPNHSTWQQREGHIRRYRWSSQVIKNGWIWDGMLAADSAKLKRPRLGEVQPAVPSFQLIGFVF